MSNQYLLLVRFACLILSVGVLLNSYGTAFGQINVAEKEEQQESSEVGSEDLKPDSTEEVAAETDPAVETDNVNVAESSSGSIAAGQSSDVSVDDAFPDVEPIPVPQRNSGALLSEESRRRLGLDLPSVAEGQPGFIPDTLPTDLFADEESMDQRSFYFDTLLGNPKLPSGNADALIERYGRKPEEDLTDNQVRIVVPTGSISGSVESKQFKVDGGLTIYFNEVSITANFADIDEKNEVAILYENVNIVDPKYSIKTDKLLLYFKQ